MDESGGGTFEVPLNGGPRGQLEALGNRENCAPGPIMRSFLEPIRQILPIGTQWTRFVQWIYECRGLRAQNCVADRALCQGR